MKNILDLAIIGGGVAGLTAGLYAARANINAVLFEEIYPGGQTATVETIQNYPGFPEGIEGSTLMQNMHEQAVNAGMQTRFDKIISISRDGALTITTDDNEVIEVKTVIIATGASPRKLGLALEEKLTGRGVHYCATCDGAFYKDKIVMVNGGGNTALTDCLVLAKFAKKVYLVHRRDSFRGDQVLVNRVDAEEKIEIIYSHTIDSLVGDTSLQSVKVASTIDNTTSEIAVDGLFVAVGILPSSDFVKGVLELTQSGEIITDDTLLTSVQGVYAVGDVRNTKLRQVVTAASDGALATIMAMDYISKL